MKRLLLTAMLLASSPVWGAGHLVAGISATQHRLVALHAFEEMPITTAAPWGAVGFLDNGCTATLIAPDTILTAGHCVTFSDQNFYRDKSGTSRFQESGAWQDPLTELYFFPNYHPDRFSSSRIPVVRAITGNRVLDGDDNRADWAIAKLAWPAFGYPTLDLAVLAEDSYPATIRFAGYGRHEELFPARHRSFPQPPPGNFCSAFGSNCWWIPATIDTLSVAPHRIRPGQVAIDRRFDMFTGGNSGTAILKRFGDTDKIVGVSGQFGSYWSTESFIDAPRYAGGVAVSTYEGDVERTQVFVTDADHDRVRSRYRSGGDLSDPFNFYRDLGRIPSGESIAAFQLSTGRPQIVVSHSSGPLRTAAATSSGRWGSWENIPMPSGVTGFIDFDIAQDPSGDVTLYAVAPDGEVYFLEGSSHSTEVSWGSWTSLGFTDRVYRISVGVHRYDDQHQVFVLTDDSAAPIKARARYLGGGGWYSEVTFATSADVSDVEDIDVGWARNGNLALFAISSSGEGWSRDASSTWAFSWWGWASWDVPLHNLSTRTPLLDGVSTITADRWIEGDAVTARNPVVFVTDDQGNIYMSQQDPSGDWSEWRSFYQYVGL